MLAIQAVIKDVVTGIMADAELKNFFFNELKSDDCRLHVAAAMAATLVAEIGEKKFPHLTPKQLFDLLNRATV
jgi:aspartate/tyrosine/aromatic aminotransferase